MNLRRIFRKNWWVVICILMSGGLYVEARHSQIGQIRSLQEKVTQLKVAEKEAMKGRGTLRLKLQSQDDPDYLELAMKERLGVVAEGEVKVVFP